MKNRVCIILLLISVFTGCEKGQERKEAPARFLREVVKNLPYLKTLNRQEQKETPVRSFKEMIENPPYSDTLSRVEYRGKSVYLRYCQVCHGAEGDGKGFNAFNLQNSFGIQPADFTDSTVMAALMDKEMIGAISKGGKSVGKSRYMPPWGGTLSGEEIEDVIAYVKALSRLKQEGGE